MELAATVKEDEETVPEERVTGVAVKVSPVVRVSTGVEVLV